MVNALKFLLLFSIGVCLPAIAQTPLKSPSSGATATPAVPILTPPKPPAVAHYQCSPNSQDIIYFFAKTPSEGKSAGDYRQIYVSQTGDSSVSERSPWQLYSLMFKSIARRDGTEGTGFVTGGPLQNRLQLKPQTIEGRFLAQYKDRSGNETSENWKVKVTTSGPESLNFNGKKYSVYQIREEVDIAEKKQSMKFEVWYAPSLNVALKTRLNFLGQLLSCDLAPVDTLTAK